MAILTTATVTRGNVPARVTGLAGLGCGCNWVDDFGECIDPEPCASALPLCKDLPPVPADFQGPFSCDGSQGPVPTISADATPNFPASCPAGQYPGVVQGVPGCYPPSYSPGTGPGSGPGTAGQSWWQSLLTSITSIGKTAVAPAGFVKRADGSYYNAATGQVIHPASTGISTTTVLLVGGVFAVALLAGGKK